MRLKADAIVRPKQWASWWLIAVLLLAFGARVYRLDHQSFWNDEGNSASLSSRSVPLIIEGTASDVHPPLYYLTLRAWWPLAGQSDFSLRMISAVTGVIQVAGTIAIGRMWLLRKEAVAVGLLMALSPPLVYYSQEARMYALLGAIATLSMLLLFKGLEVRSQKVEAKSGGDESTFDFVLPTFYFLLTAVGLYTHYVYPAVIVAQGLIVLLVVGQRHRNLQKMWHDAWRWLAAVLVALLVYAPWIPIFLRTGSSTRDAGSTEAFTFLQEVAMWLLGGPFARLEIGGPFYFCFGVLFLLGLVACSSRKYGLQISILTIWLLVPIILMLAVGATDDNYRKFLTVAVPPVFLIAIIGIEWINGMLPLRKLHNYLSGVAILLFVPVVGLFDLYTNPSTFRDDYRGIAELIQQEGRDGAAVILNAPNQWEVFSWYAGEDGAQTLYPMPKSRRPDEQIEQEVEAVLAEHDFVYVLFWGFEGFDPNRIVERTLDQQAFKSTDQWYGDVRLATYGVLGDFLPNETNLPDLEVNQEFLLPDGNLGSGVKLNWVEMSDSEFKPGDVIGLALEWEALQDVEGRFKVFIHLIDENGKLVAQRDSEPVGNLKPTDGWGAGEVVLDQHGVLVPAGLPTGEYELVIGLYDVFSPNGRLMIDGADQITVSNLVVR